MINSRLRLHAFIAESRANGPGVRAVIWMQGCTLGCPGCFNPETHSFNDGEETTVNDCFQRISAVSSRIEGLTISGGEPLQQLRPLLALLQRVKQETDLSVLILTGYTWDEVRRMAEADELLACADVLITGRYDQERRLARDLRGSANKIAHFLSERYDAGDLQAVAPAEIIISAKGDVVMSGIDPMRW
jgi:anaerobic ribonucleoside-triphosphate reductase activating protein